MPSGSVRVLYYFNCKIMQRLFLLAALTLLLGMGACSNDHSDDGTGTLPKGPGEIDLGVTSRIGSVVGENLTTYVKSLNLLLFKENSNGVYLLANEVFYTKEQLTALATGETGSAPGFTESRTVVFDGLPVGNYKIVGVGNMKDSVGTPIPAATLEGLTNGNTMTQVMAAIADGSTSPYLFYGQTDPILVGSDLTATPSLMLFRKVAMFALTLEDVPQVVRKIDMNIESTYGAFNMTGAFVDTEVNEVRYSKSFVFTEDQKSLPLGVVMLPTIITGASNVTLIFTLDNGQEITIPLPKQYIFKANTITKLTATIDANQSGGTWEVQLSLSVSADVEWNVDQEPGIII